MSTDLPGDGSDRTEWLIRYQPWLHYLARREIDSRFLGKYSASDAVQQTLLEAWKNWDQFRGTEETQRLAWLRKILAHQLAYLARHFAGTKKRDVKREVSIEQSMTTSSDRLAAILPANDSSPSFVAQRNEQTLELAAILQQLPDDYRQVIELRHLDQLSHPEIAKQMGRSEAAVRMLWVRALAKLRQAAGEA
ncbi:MAG: hypothetical protein CBB71_11700 [Rhodopirellula sp. TMED11]|nr:MAG: hypothetical protein CBB71_11700 [Rhodopirellula sp. TMED11]